jgi:D-alanyl-D-alanine-carboxypeptidase/D-alanyl-D-alanine-endopeptidase
MHAVKLPRTFPVLPVLLFVLVLVSSLSQAQAPSSLVDFPTAGAIGENLYLQSGSTGMVLVLVRGGQVFFRGYGQTAPGSHQLPTQQSVLRICSLTKIFTTDVLAKLAADGTVRLNDPLQRFAPPHLVVPRSGRPITLLNLATHTSGLPREVGSGPRGTPHFTFPEYATRWRWLPRQRLRRPPGTAALYSNIAFDFLADSLQSAAHQPYPALLAERTLNPLHMRNTTFYPTAAQCSLLLQAAWDEGPCAVTEATDGSSGLYSTAGDMALWLQYLLGAGADGAARQDSAAQTVYVLPADLVSQAGLDHAGQPTGIGLGWIHLLPPGDPSHTVEKTGGGAGFTTYIAMNQSRHTAIFVAATWGPVDTHFNLFNAANNLLLAVSGLPPLPPPAPLPIKRVRRNTRRVRRQ